jgi:hypothetical protein
MQTMLKDIFTIRRRQTPRSTRNQVDHRSVRRTPDPMPRIRWYS